MRGIEIAQVQPLVGEVGDQGARAGIGQHPAHLLFERRRVVKFAARGRVQQFVVRNAAPEEKGEAGGQFEIADAVGGPGGSARRILFHPEEELGADQDGTEGHLDTRFVAAFGARVAVELHGRLEIGLRYRPPVGTARQRGQNAFGARLFLAGVCGRAEQNTLAAWAVAGTLRVVGTDHRDGVDGRLDARVAVHIEMGLVGLALGLEQSGVLLRKRGGDLVGTRLDRNAHVDVLIDRVVILARCRVA